LSFYQARSGYVYFRNPSVILQAARFVNPAPGHIKEISVALGGASANGTARLRIFGHEGGVPAPILEDDLIEPIILHKSKIGFERITVQIPERPFLANNQFFVAVDQIDSGIVFLSDHLEKQPFCSANDDEFYFQLLKQSDGGWRWEKYSFAVDVVMDYPSVSPRYPMGDVAYGLGIVDTMLYNRSIAWADVDENGYLDLLWDGRLYLNREGEAFELANDEMGITGKPAANLFLDANNDGDIDILFLGSQDTAASQSILFLGSGGLSFTRIDLKLPSLNHTTSFSLSDINGDGYLDLFVGQAHAQTTAGEVLPNSVSSHILLNTGGKGFVDASDRISLVGIDSTSRGYGSQFFDADRDGDPDLYLARRYPDRSLLLFNDGTGYFSSKQSSGHDMVQELGAGSGGDWKDFDNDGDLDLLYPRLIHPYLRKYRDAEGSGIYSHTDQADHLMAKLPAESGGELVDYEERHAGGVWGDADNDGLLDAFFTTTGDCRFAELYTQNPDHTFTLNTFDYGLHWSSAGDDAVWVDFDNDGWLDLCAIEWNRLKLYKNPGDGDENDFVEIDPVQKNGTHDVGARVTVHAGNLHMRREVTLGRGILMGDPPRLHYGLGRNNVIDSVEVEWSNGVREIFTSITVDTITKLIQGSSGRTVASGKTSITAVPNPFSDELHIYYTLPERQKVRLEIYDQSGTLIKVLLEEEVEGGEHTAVWKADNSSGTKAPAGVYIYRLVLPSGEVNGRAVLTR
ncbi:MAG: FG-GAP-like repeat-containing protein, partial [Candidatus Kapaibacterium sp.]